MSLLEPGRSPGIYIIGPHLPSLHFSGKYFVISHDLAERSFHNRIQQAEGYKKISFVIYEKKF